MFRSDSTEKLREEIDRFDVAMFIAEPSGVTGEFEILALNDEHERQSGMVMADVLGRPITSLLPATQADAVRQKYNLCLRQSTPLRYREILTLPNGKITWDTTLYHIVKRSGSHRIVGSGVVVHCVQRDKRDLLAFEDVRYFASSASRNLGQVAQVLDAFDEGILDAANFPDTVGFLSGLCRSIDSTMKDLLKIAEQRLAEEFGAPMGVIDDRDGPTAQGEAERAMSILIDLSTQMLKPA